MYHKTVLLLLLVSLGGSWAALELDSCDSDSYRLPKSIVPTHYDLLVDIDLKRDIYEGEVDIHVEVKEKNEQLAQNQIALHATKWLSLNKVEYKDVSSGVQVEVGDICRNKNDVVIISLAEDLVVGSQGVLHISYTGEYGDNKNGFYKSEELSSKKQRYEIALTQFEPIDARNAFPCFDEPTFKATYNISIIHDKNQEALSNCEKISQEVVTNAHGEEKFKSTFNKTPYMSTYLVAFVVGQFDYIEKIILDGRVTLRFYTPLGRAEESRFALEAAAKSLPLLEDYFGIDFPLKKIDLVSVRDYSFGAMENWGLITCLETMLMDNTENMSYSPATAAQTTVHELAHQWFGNLVTMEWWNDLWLNEGFANWVEYNMTAVLMPETDFEGMYVQDAVHHIYRSDFDKKERAVARREHNENISTDTVDLIVYNKGSSIIKNLQREYLHPDNFRSALRHYMKTHAYGNAKSEDLWHSMELYSKEPVAQFMESWLYQDGHPIVSAEVRNGFLSLKQSVFTHNKAELEDPEKRWVIPVTILVSDSNSRQEVISVTLTGEREEEQVTLPEWFNLKVSSHWLKLNARATGLYNVEYSAELLQNLRRPIEKKLMSPLDRLDILMNYVTVFQAKHQYRQPVELSKFIKWFKTEDHYTVLKGLIEAVGVCNQMNKSSSAKFFLKIFGNFLDKHSFKDTPELDYHSEQTRLTILLKALRYKHKPTIKSLLKMADETTALDQLVEPYKTSLYNTVMAHGSSKHKNTLRIMVNNMDDSPRKAYILEEMDKAGKGSSRFHKIMDMLGFD